MSRAIKPFRILALGLTLTAGAAWADDKPVQSELRVPVVPEVVIVAEPILQSELDAPELIEREVRTMIDSEVLLDLNARIMASASRT